MSRELAIENEIYRNISLKELEPALLNPKERKEGKRLAFTPRELRNYLVTTFGNKEKDIPTIAELKKRR